MRIASRPLFSGLLFSGLLVSAVTLTAGTAQAQQGQSKQIDCSREIVFDNGWTLQGLRAVREACSRAPSEDGKGIRRVSAPIPALPVVRTGPARPVTGNCPGRMADRVKEASPPGRLDVAFTFKFGANVDAFPPAAMASLVAFGKHLAEFYPSGQIQIVGHADASGNDDMNDALSFRRAENAVRVISDGDPELGRRLHAVGSGARELRPDVGPCDEAQRRIEARIPLN